ncbi:MAG: AMP-binding protein, partial [Microthrixaceae bacterium]
MTLLMLLEMIASAFGDRLGIGTVAHGLTYRQLHARAGAGAEVLRAHGARHLAYVGSSDEAFPVALFAAAWAGVPFIPLNYRLGEGALRSLLAAHDDVLVVADESTVPIVAGSAATILTIDEWNKVTSEPV